MTGSASAFTFLMPANSVFLSSHGGAPSGLQKAGIEMDNSKPDWRPHQAHPDKGTTPAPDLDGLGRAGRPVQSGTVADQGRLELVASPTGGDEIIRAARVEFDPVRRSALYRSWGAVLYEEQPYCSSTSGRPRRGEERVRTSTRPSTGRLRRRVDRRQGLASPK
jgi:hypothetical protein